MITTFASGSMSSSSTLSDRSTPSEGPQPQRVRIPCSDGYELGGLLFEASPSAASEHKKTPPRVLLLCGAIGVPCAFYRSFAAYAAQKMQYSCLLFDYRGIGISLPPGHDQPTPRMLRALKHSMNDWGHLDIQAAIEFLSHRCADGGSIQVLAHSAGGQVLGLCPSKSLHKIRSLYTIGSQAGYWKNWPFPHCLFIYGMSVAVNLLSHTFGYFPANLLGMGEPMGPGIGKDWGMWIRLPGYIRDPKAEASRDFSSSYETLTCPAQFATFVDDVRYAPKKAVDRLAEFYPNTRPRIRRDIQPHEIGQSQVGHFFMFKPACSPFWEQVFAWFQRCDNPEESGEGLQAKL
mgnify:FL=1